MDEDEEENSENSGIISNTPTGSPSKDGLQSGEETEEQVAVAEACSGSVCF